MAIQPAFANIPFLSTLPDIPTMYSSNPSFSFMVDLILLCVLFGSILAPLGERVLKEKKSGKQFGAVLGIIFGAGAAFALRDAGVPLFQHWLLAIAITSVISVVLYKILTALGGSKGLAMVVCALTAGILISFWVVKSQSTDTARWFAVFAAILAITLPVILLFWLLMKTAGMLGGGPLNKWWNEDIKSGWNSGGLTGLAKGILRGPKRILSGWTPQATEDEARPRHEEERGGAVAAASEREDAAAAETEKAAIIATEGAKEVVSAGDEGARIAEEFKNALNALLTIIVTLLNKTDITKADLDRLYTEIILVQKKYSSFNSPLNKLRSGFGKIQSFETDIKKSILEHNQFKLQVDKWDSEDAKARIDRLSPQERAALMPKYNALNTKKTKLKKLIESIEATITRMQNEHLPFLTQVKLQTEYAALGQYFARITTSMNAAVGYIKPIIDAYAHNPDTPFQNRSKEALGNIKLLFEQILTVDVIKLKASWETLAATQTARYEQIKNDISSWTRGYKKIKKPAIAEITADTEALDKLIAEAEQRQRGAATRQQAVQQGAATTATPLTETLEEIYAIKKKLADMIKGAIALANAVSNTEKFTKGDKKLKTAARDAIDVAVANARFAGVEKNEVEKLIKAITLTLTNIKTNISGMKSAGIPNTNPELLQLIALESNLRSFLDEEGKISNLLTNTEKVLAAQVTAAVSESKTKTVTGAKVKALLVEYIKDLQSNLEFLKTETNYLENIGKALLKRPQLPARRKPLV